MNKTARVSRLSPAKTLSHLYIYPAKFTVSPSEKLPVSRIEQNRIIRRSNWLANACVLFVTALLGVGYFAQSMLASDSAGCIVDFSKSEIRSATGIPSATSRSSSCFDVSTRSPSLLGSDPAQLVVTDVRSPETYSIDLSAKSKSENTKLPQVAILTLERNFNGTTESIDQFAKHFTVPPQYKRRAGLFVTFSHKGKTRACWGSIDAKFADLVKATVYTAQEALTNEYRHQKIKEREIKTLKAQVTVIEKLVPITSIHGQDPIKCGLMVRSGNRTAVILPGEATDAYYQLVLCKLKAAIPIKQKCQMYRIIADVYI